MRKNEVIPISTGMVNVFLIRGERCILVDTGLPGKAERILEGLKKNNIDPQNISLIIATHNHGDHVGGLSKLRELTGAKVAIHKNEAEALRQGKSTEVKAVKLQGKIIRMFFKRGSVNAIEPDIIIEDELKLDKYGVKGKAIHTPGHTPGSLSIITSDGDAIVGDLISAKETRKGSKAKPPVFASDMREVKQTLRRIVKLSPKVIYTSHGEACTVDAVKKLISKMNA